MAHRILVCDDEPHIALAVGMKFRNAGFAVQTARNGQEAWEAILQSPPDVLITDCTMPRMDGLELCRRVRKSAGLSELPVFLLTARGLELDPFVVSDELRITQLILKPFSPHNLFQAVQETLRRKPTPVASPV